MGVREVTIYTCDGCKTSATLNRTDRARGWHTLGLSDGKKYVLCTLCYGAVEWVAKFQEITVAPKVYKGPDGKYSLRTWQQRRPGEYVCTKDPGCPVESGGGGINGSTHSARCAKLNGTKQDPTAEVVEEEDWLEEDDEE